MSPGEAESWLSVPAESASDFLFYFDFHVIFGRGFLFVWVILSVLMLFFWRGLVNKLRCEAFMLLLIDIQ